MGKKCRVGYKKKEGKCVKSKSFSNIFKIDQRYNWIFLIIGILLISGIFIYAGFSGWFKGIYSQSYSITEGDINNFLNNPEYSSSCSLDLTPNSIYAGNQVTGTLTDGANTKCYLIANDGSGWKLVYEGTTDSNGIYSEARNIDIEGNFIFRAICDINHNNQMDIQDCLTNQETLTVLNNPGDCTDSDGDNRDTPGHVTTSSDIFYDQCLEVGQAVTEYICVNGAVTSKNWACDYGETCIQTRSGGHCVESGYDVGDVVGGGSNSGIITGNSPMEETFDLGNVAVGGNHYLGARIHTDWAYANDKCSGIMGSQGLEWLFSDSEAVKWGTTDTTPRVHDTELCPLVWDGLTPWKLKALPISSNLPECQLNYNYNVEIFVCE